MGDESKWVLHSRTVWLNVIVGVSGFLALPELTHLLPEGAVKYLLLLQAGLNIAMRLMTNQAVTMKPEQP